MNPIEMYDILTLDDNKEYVVANMLTRDDIEYLYLIEIDKDENPIDNNQKMVKRVFQNGEESVEILDEEEQKEIAPLFFELFSEMSESEN